MSVTAQHVSTRRQYTDDERATALVALDMNHGNVSRTSRQLGIPRCTLSQWAEGTRHPELLHLKHHKKSEMAEVCREAIWLMLGISMGKAEQASFIDLMRGVGIAVDKLILLTGG